LPRAGIAFSALPARITQRSDRRRPGSSVSTRQSPLRFRQPADRPGPVSPRTQLLNP
jgi:hypothetical protein